jgi:hypothetical protein
MYSRVARSPGLFAVSQILAALGSHLVSPFSGWLRLPAFTGWGFSKDLPRFAARPFRERFDRLPMRGENSAAELALSNAEVNAKNQKQKAKGESEVKDESAPPAKVNLESAAQFAAELIALGGSLVRTSAADLTIKVIDFLHSRQIDRIHLEPGVLDEAELQQAGITFTAVPDPALRLGATRAVCGLADTGSVLIVDGAGSPLHASLLPEIHLVVLRLSGILPSLADALALPQIRLAKAAVVVTGPSRTADIEMTLTIGVHGPGEVLVFLIDDSQPG